MQAELDVVRFEFEEFKRRTVEAFKVLSALNGSPAFGTRSAVEVMNGEHAFYCQYKSGETCTCSRQFSSALAL